MYKKLPVNTQHKAQRRESLFRKEPFAAALKTHKLSGTLDGLYAFSVDYTTRIIFEFFSENPRIVRFHAIGDHDIYE